MSGQTPPNQVPSATPSQSIKTPTSTYIKTAIWTIVAVYVILFVLLNREQVQINFVFFQMDIALIFVLIGLLVVGGALGFSFAKLRQRSAAKKQNP